MTKDEIEELRRVIRERIDREMELYGIQASRRTEEQTADTNQE